MAREMKVHNHHSWPQSSTIRLTVASAATVLLILAMLLIGEHMAICAPTRPPVMPLTPPPAPPRPTPAGGNEFLPSQSATVVRRHPTPVTGVFQRIYDRNGWGPDGNGSGVGSSMAATKRARLAVELLATRYGVTSLLDVPCGGMAWMPEAVQRLQTFVPGFRYGGVDVVPSVVQAAANRLKKAQGFEFWVLDMAQQELPRGYEMILSRDALQHLSYDLIVPTLENFARSDARYLVVGSYKGGANKNVANGDYFDIDLRRPPFSLDAPLDVIDEESEYSKVLLVYDVVYLKTVDFGKMRKAAGLPP